MERDEGLKIHEEWFSPSRTTIGSSKCAADFRSTLMSDGSTLQGESHLMYGGSHGILSGHQRNTDDWINLNRCGRRAIRRSHFPDPSIHLKPFFPRLPPLD